MKTLFAVNTDVPSTTMMRSFRLAPSTLSLDAWKRVIKRMSSCGAAAVFMTFGVFGTDPQIALSLGEFLGRKHIEHAAAVHAENIQKAFEREEILWLARAVHSETDVVGEMSAIAWTVRNRVENEWYPSTYEEVVLQPYQFSGLNDFDYHYERNMARDFDTEDPIWHEALAIARSVYYADDTERVVPAGVMHFYSPVAVGTPEWAIGLTPVKEFYGKRGVRFAFYQGVK